jgi:hypothetical protein
MAMDAMGQNEKAEKMHEQANIIAKEVTLSEPEGAQGSRSGLFKGSARRLHLCADDALKAHVIPVPCPRLAHLLFASRIFCLGPGEAGWR